jgi:hypothetical protein
VFEHTLRGKTDSAKLTVWKVFTCAKLEAGRCEADRLRVIRLCGIGYHDRSQIAKILVVENVSGTNRDCLRRRRTSRKVETKDLQASLPGTIVNCNVELIKSFMLLNISKNSLRRHQTTTIAPSTT